MSQSIAVNISSSGSNPLIDGKPNQRIQVTQMVLMSHGDVDITFKSGEAVLWYNLPFAGKGDGIVIPDTGKFWLQTDTGEALTAILSDSVHITGILWYRYA